MAAKSKKVETWRAKFIETSTKTAFNLTLSKNHVRLLETLEHAPESGCEDFLNFRSDMGIDSMTSTFRGLERRGLAEHNSAEIEKITPPGIGWQKIKWVYRLTPAGHAVLSLLRIAGIVEESKRPPKLNVKAKRKAG